MFVYVVKHGPMLHGAYHNEAQANRKRDKLSKEPDWYPEWSWTVTKMEVE